MLGSNLQNGLRLISSYHDVLEMVIIYKETPIIELYGVSFDGLKIMVMIKMMVCMRG